MKKHHSLLSLLPVAALVGTASGQAFNFPNFPNANGLALDGDALVTGNMLQITPNVGAASGAAYYDTPVPVSGGFSTTFVFQISNDGADGFAFIVQNDSRGTTARGEDGTSLAYSSYTTPGPLGIENSIVVEFDTWLSDPSSGDTSANEIAIHTDGLNDNRYEETYSLGAVTPLVDMSDGQPHTVRIDYLAGQLSVYLDNMMTPVLSVPYDFATGGTHYMTNTPVGGLNLINGTSAYVGFTGSTGGVTEEHNIMSWDFGPLSLGTPYCTAVANSTGSPSALTASGSNVVATNDLTLEASDLPQNSFGFFLTSRTQAVVPNPGGSAGNLCLGGSIGRYVGAGQIKNSGTAGEFSLLLDLAMTPTPNGLVQIVAGETWNFQAWHRDSVGGSATSNFTNGLEIGFL